MAGADEIRILIAVVYVLVRLRKAKLVPETQLEAGMHTLLLQNSNA